MLYSNKQLSQLIIETCITYNVERVVISPGSRNAPLIIGFTNHPQIKTYSIVDERCAAFFGLGIAKQSQKPVVLVCTSGSALLNYYPAIAEAFYSNIPLIIISADRPKHLIDIGDGQTIRQENVFANHSLFNANLTNGESFFEDNTELISSVFEIAIAKNGPVHLNVPFDEPLYGTTDKLCVKPLVGRPNLNETKVDYNLDNFIKIWQSSPNKIILIGANYPNDILQQQLCRLILDESVLVFTETTSNVHHKKFINGIDKLIFPLKDSDFELLKPEILLTLGGMIVSKRVKHFLRNHQPRHHWHLDVKNAPDTYHCLTEHIKIKPTSFFSQLLEKTNPVKSGFQQKWLTIKDYRNRKHNEFVKNVEFSDFKVIGTLLNRLPNNILLHLGNSSVIRYAQLFDSNISVNVFCNRGTSGIDGSTSTAIGAAHVIEKQTIIITGDISFFYDSNALWNKYIPKNFRIIIINNNGGGIFKILPGPQQTNSLDYFETKHQLTAEHLCKMYQLEYVKATNILTLSNQLESFFQDSNHPKLLEVFTTNNLNDVVLKAYFKYIQ